MDREAVVGVADAGLSGIQEKPLGMAEFVKLLPGVPSEALLLSYCGVLTSHYSAVTSYYSAVAELAKERTASELSAVSSVKQSAVESEALASGQSEASSGGGSVSIGSSASTGKQARKARRRMRKLRKANHFGIKSSSASAPDWRSQPAMTASEAPKPLKPSLVSSGSSNSSMRSSVLSVGADESKAADVMSRKRDIVAAQGQGYCYLYAVCDHVMAQVARELGPDPLFSDLLTQPVELFESAGCLAALRVDVSSGNGHVVSSGCSGLTRLWTLCCSVDWREYAPGTLGYSTRQYMTCSAVFVRQKDFRLGASGAIDLNTRQAEFGSFETGQSISIADKYLSLLKSVAVDEFSPGDVYSGPNGYGFRVLCAGLDVLVHTDVCKPGSIFLPRLEVGIGVYCFSNGSVQVNEIPGLHGMVCFSKLSPCVFVRRSGCTPLEAHVVCLSRTVCISLHFSPISNAVGEIWFALRQAGMLHVTAIDADANLQARYNSYRRASPDADFPVFGIIRLLTAIVAYCYIPEMEYGDFDLSCIA